MRVRCPSLTTLQSLGQVRQRGTQTHSRSSRSRPRCIGCCTSNPEIGGNLRYLVMVTWTHQNHGEFRLCHLQRAQKNLRDYASKRLGKELSSMESNKLLAVIRLRGAVKVRREINDTLKMLRLHHVNHATIIKNSPSYLGMLQKAKDSVSYTHLTLPRLLTCRSRWSPYH